MITYNDLRYMIENEDLHLKSEFTNSNRTVTKADILARTYADPFYMVTYANNQLVPYHRITQAIYSTYPTETTIPVPAAAGGFALDIVNPKGNSIGISDNQSWLLFSPSNSSSTSFNINVSYTLNSGPSARTAILTVTDQLTGMVLNFTIEQQGQPAIPTDPVAVAWGGTQSEACSFMEPVTMYVPEGDTFTSATTLYSNSAGNVNAPAGWYSDGTYAREWNGTSFLVTNIC